MIFTFSLWGRRNLSLALVFLFFSANYAWADITVYSLRTQDVIKPIIDQFTADTGITVNTITASGSGLIQRLINEQETSPADIVIANGIDDLSRLEQAGILGTLPSLLHKRSIKKQYLAASGKWVAFAIRARVLVYNKSKIKKEDLQSYADLANPTMLGLTCARPSGNSYDPPLVASLIAHQGATKTSAWLAAFVSNFARPPQSNDRGQIRDVAKGVCGVAMVNSYYLGLMLNSENNADRAFAESVGVVFPNTKKKGTHINGAAVGVTRWSKKYREATAFIDYLTSFKTQRWITQNSFEFSVRADVPPAAAIKKLSHPIRFDRLRFSVIGENISTAILLLDNAEWR